MGFIYHQSYQPRLPCKCSFNYLLIRSCLQTCHYRYWRILIVIGNFFTLFFSLVVAGDNIVFDDEKLHIISKLLFQTTFLWIMQVVVHFTAAWCMPSVAMNHFFEELASTYQDILFLSVDVDEVKVIVNYLFKSF